MEAGNNVTDSSFMRAMSAFEKYIGKNTKVAEVAQVVKVADDNYTCQLLADSEIKIICICCDGIEIARGDIVVILFMDSDPRMNIKRVKIGLEPQNLDINRKRHQYNFGVIINKI